MKDVSSEQELLELLRDGKITEEEYQQLLKAMGDHQPQRGGGDAAAKREFPRLAVIVVLLSGAFVLGSILLHRVFFRERVMVTQEEVSSNFSRNEAPLNRQRGTVRLEEFRRDFSDKVASLDIDTAKLSDVIETFGEPIEYVWGRKRIDREAIPVDRYCMKYPDDFMIFMQWDSIVELRFESPAADYVFSDQIRVGSSLDEVLAFTGAPSRIVAGKQIGWVDKVLYKDVEGREGQCYYRRSDYKVRFFFVNYRVNALYVTRSDYN